MKAPQTFAKRGVVEGFFGPPWSTAQRKALFAFGSRRGMNTYLYAPKDDPYHRERWREPYPRARWRNLLELIRHARACGIEFVYGFHPAKGLCFSADEPVDVLLRKAQRFFDSGVRTFAVLFDDIPARLAYPRDRRQFQGSLARAEGSWLQTITARQPASWREVEWWICPSYYTPDPLLERVFGVFEENFLEKLSECLPVDTGCFWTGPRVVPRRITRQHVKQIAGRLKRPLILWDNYPVNDLSMRDELHIGPLQGRDARLPEHVYAYLNNPLLQEELSFVPLGTCFDYAAKPAAYDPERSWTRAVRERFGGNAVRYWRIIRSFAEKSRRAKESRRTVRLNREERSDVRAALEYLRARRAQRWAQEMRPWTEQMERLLGTTV